MIHRWRSFFLKKKIVALKHVSGVELTCMLQGELSSTIDEKIFLQSFSHSPTRK